MCLVAQEEPHPELLAVPCLNAHDETTLLGPPIIVKALALGCACLIGGPQLWAGRRLIPGQVAPAAVDSLRLPCSIHWLDRSNWVTMRQLRAGLIGAGLVGQAEHAFYLWEERERFAFVALADASPSVRAAVGARYGIGALHAGIDGMLTCDLDALVIAAPDPFHPALAIAALDAGLHVLCEKPLALTVAGCDQIAAARDRSGSVVQVAYMKRYDPAYRRALDFLPERIEDVKLISVEVNDPDHEPFVAHLPMTWPNDIAAALREQTRALSAAQLREAAGGSLDEAEARALGRRVPVRARARRGDGAWHACPLRLRAAGGRPTTARCSTKAAACSWRSPCPEAGASA